MTETPEYRTWCHLKERTTNPRDEDIKRYMERGIDCCERWLNSFEAFFNDMGLRPSPRHSIERLDNDKGYSPENCVWATKKTQARNRRTNALVVLHDREMCVSEACEILGINSHKIYYKVWINGVTHQQALEHFMSGMGGNAPGTPTQQ